MCFHSLGLEKKQKRDGRFAIVFFSIFLLLLFLFYKNHLPEKDAIELHIKHLRLNPEKQLYLSDKEKITVHLESLPLFYYPFFFLPLPINSADKDLLMTLKGVGPTLAETIVRYREKNAVISNIEDLRKIPGIGRKRTASLVTQLVFDKEE